MNIETFSNPIALTRSLSLKPSPRAGISADSFPHRNLIQINKLRTHLKPNPINREAREDRKGFFLAFLACFAVEIV